MKATLTRGDSTDQGTFGRLTFGATTVHTIELPWRDNRRKRSCIPPGVYALQLFKSTHFGPVYKLLDVPDRDACLIHPANFAGDVELGWCSQLEGCIAPAMRVGALRNPAGRMQAAGLVSRPAWNLFMSWAAGGAAHILEIRQ